MIIIVVLIAIVFLFLGYIVMDRIDKFIAYNTYVMDEFQNQVGEDKKDESVILIYGESDLVSLIKGYCNIKKYLYHSINDISNIKSTYKYSILLALSNNDADNLMVGTIGLKFYSIPIIVGLCNKQDNFKIYKEFKFDKIIFHDSDTRKVFDSIKNLLNNKKNRIYFNTVKN